MTTGPKPRTPHQVYSALFVNATEDGTCIIPSKRPMPAGYIQVLVNGVYGYAHRFVFAMNYGPIPAGVVIRHLCNNKACINPDHLADGTHADNVADKINAGRMPQGITHYRASLLPNQIREIREDKTDTYAELSREYGISRGGIKHIKDRRSWKTIQ